MVQRLTYRRRCVCASPRSHSPRDQEAVWLATAAFPRQGLGRRHVRTLADPARTELGRRGGDFEACGCVCAARARRIALCRRTGGAACGSVDWGFATPTQRAARGYTAVACRSADAGRCKQTRCRLCGAVPGSRRTPNGVGGGRSHAEALQAVPERCRRDAAG